MLKYDGSARCKAFETLQLLLTRAQVELGVRMWEGDLQRRIECASEWRNELFEAICAYAKAREEERGSWMAL